MHLTKATIQNLDRIKRLNLINAITGIKPANLIGTISSDQTTNLAIFSSVVHLGSNPALIGFVMRPTTAKAPRHTYENILKSGCYTINHIHESFIERAHYTSAKFDRAVSEFDRCRLTEEYLPGFAAPFVRESALKMGLQFLEEIPIPANGTRLMIGEIRHLIVPDGAVDENGLLDLGRTDGIGISGLNSYYRLGKIASFPYARPEGTPDFS